MNTKHYFFDQTKNKMLFCIQDKWIAGKVSNSQLNHFINYQLKD